MLTLVPPRPLEHPRETIPQDVLDRLARTLRRLEDFDLAGYRRAYVERRVTSRVGVTGETPDAYARRVETDADERRQLVEALGVNVTSFFRDPGVWHFLEQVAFPPLVDEILAAGEQVRALSLGCAGGQEAYSLAMMLSEMAGGATDPFVVDAWDMDGAALEVAREAWYPRAAVENLAAPALERYFVPEGEGFRVTSGLRSRVRVERRDMLTADLPGEFDVVLLRNVAIYFDREAKERLFQRVHHLVAPRGLVVLGQAETMVGKANELFRPLSLRNRVYAKVVR